MAKCKQCGKEYESKRITSSYCGPKCKQEFYRNRMKDVTVTLVTAKETKSVTVTDPEQSKDKGVTNPCKYCGKQLDFPILECCSDCALKQPTKVSPAQDGHILASRPALEFTGKLTDFEREHYKSASELKPGKYNPVSKPGDSHYGQA